MPKLFLKQRFNKKNVSQGTMLKILQILGPFHSFLGIRTVQLIETRIMNPNNADIRLINPGKGNPSEFVMFVRSFLRTYSDGILTSYVINYSSRKITFKRIETKISE